MKKLTCCSLALLLYCVGFSQRYNTSVSDEMKLSSKSSAPIISGDKYFAIETDAKTQLGYTARLNKVKYSVKLLKYDNRLQIIKEVKLANGEKAYGPFEPMLKKLDDRLFFIHYQLSDNEDINMFVSELDEDDLSLKPAQQVMSIEVKNVGLMQLVDLMSNENIGFANTSNHSKSLIYWRSGIDNQVFFSVLDNNMKKTRSGKQAVDGETKIILHNAAVDNAGNVYMAYSNSKNKYCHILINKVDSKIIDVDVKVANGTPYNAFVVQTGNANIIKVIGTYREKFRQPYRCIHCITQ